MDTNLTYLLIAAIFALLVIIVFLLFRQKAKVDVKGPFGIGVQVDASNQLPPPTPAIKLTFTHKKVWGERRDKRQRYQPGVASRAR